MNVHDRPASGEPLTERKVVVDHANRRSHEGDGAAADRDVAAQRRDLAADRRDRAAERRDLDDRRSSRPEPEGAARDRQRSARDRRQAAHDRRRARSDRRQAGRDREQAGLDGLTGALRRERGTFGLQHEIDRARRSGERLVVAFVDVDGLKQVNDGDGHAAGDQVLRAVAAALLGGLRSYDLVVRYGGDEFLCGLPGSDLEGARRRLDAVAGILADRNPSASVSMGLAELTDSDTLDLLIARADAALYADRRDARGRALVDTKPRFTRDALHPSGR
jgi:diguanylate cyclase (GGDEF)-like protein